MFLPHYTVKENNSLKSPIPTFQTSTTWQQWCVYCVMSTVKCVATRRRGACTCVSCGRCDPLCVVILTLGTPDSGAIQIYPAGWQSGSAPWDRLATMKWTTASLVFPSGESTSNYCLQVRKPRESNPEDLEWGITNHTVERFWCIGGCVEIM